MIHPAIRWSLVLLLIPALLLIPSPHLKASTLGAVVSAVNALGGSFDTAGIIAAITALQAANTLALRNLQTENANKFTEALQLATGQQTPDPNMLTSYVNELQRLRTAWQNRDSLFDFTSATGLWIGTLNNAEANTLATRLDALGSLTGAAAIADHWRDATNRADTVTAAQIGNLYNDPVQGQAAIDAINRMREQAENDRVLDYHTLRFTDAAHWRSVELRDRISELPDGTEAAQLQAEIDLLIADAALLDASRQAQQNRAREIERLAALERWHTAELAAHAQNDASITWIQANAADMGAGLLFPEAFGPR